MRLAVSLAALLMLGGCATLPPSTRPQTASGVNEARAPLRGKLSVQVPAHGLQRAQGGSAEFELRGDATEGRLELSSPLGSLIARAQWSPQGVQLELPGQQQQFDDLDAMTRALLGEAIPVQALFAWLQGRASEGLDWQPLPAPEQGFVQLGWRVDLSRQAQGLLQASRLGEPATTLRIKLLHEAD